MKKTISIFIFIILLIPLISITSIADSGPELQVGVFGASVLTGLKQSGSFVYNSGDEDMYDVTFQFKVTGGFDNSINIVINNHQEIIPPYTVLLFTLESVNGFGPIDLTVYAHSSNAGSAEETIKGFQLGTYTITQPYLLAWV
jgi:hypothetical protein